MYLRRMIEKEELKEMSNYELFKMRKKLISSMDKRDKERIRNQHLVETNKTSPESLLDSWVEDEESIFMDDLTNLIVS